MRIIVAVLRQDMNEESAHYRCWKGWRPESSQSDQSLMARYHILEYNKTRFTGLVRSLIAPE